MEIFCYKENNFIDDKYCSYCKENCSSDGSEGVVLADSIVDGLEIILDSLLDCDIDI